MDPTKKITIHAEQADYLEYKVILRTQLTKQEELKKQTELHTAILNEAFLKAEKKRPPQPVYKHCRQCNKPNLTEKQQRYAYCIRCHTNNKVCRDYLG
jgi:hypothetical protein